MNKNDVHFYSNKLKAFFLFIVSAAFTAFGFLSRGKNLDFNNHIFKSSFLVLMFCLSILGVIIGIKLLLRTKPLLSINDKQIFIYDIFRKVTIINLNEIKSFELFAISNQYTISREILIQLKNPSEKARASLYYELLKKISLKLANTKYSIKLEFIKANRYNLLEHLNQKLKNVA